MVGENPKRSREKTEYIGMYNEGDFHAERRRLEHIIENYEPPEFGCPCCSYNKYTGRVECLDTCVSMIEDGAQCPEKTVFDAERNLTLLNTRPLMKLIFSNPNLAALNGFLKRERIVYSHA